ncbi:MAG: DUF4177 domain-containing protein [Clostridium sp.]|uniref:DUF4177 domain-containing protein n=1 Tax=Clostridium sp. TaxID=1506 RepID=UPI002910AC01|nr:DUF4177 domain-containing protein [Clostridium sp.]MDU5109390.1 DUF4177 domain-containing protein [Clostridium sp.]
MYRYLFVECKVGGFWGKTNYHRDEIEKYALHGWRFVSAIPKGDGSQGRIALVDLVFEKEEEESLEI